MNQVNWEIFNYKRSLTLSRLDLCYSHTKTNHDISIRPFLQRCFHKVPESKAIKNFNLHHNYSSWILKIGKRKNLLMTNLIFIYRLNSPYTFIFFYPSFLIIMLIFLLFIKDIMLLKVTLHLLMKLIEFDLKLPIFLISSFVGFLNLLME